MSAFHITVEVNGETIFEDDVVEDDGESAYNRAYDAFLDRVCLTVTPTGPGPDHDPED